MEPEELAGPGDAWRSEGWPAADGWSGGQPESGGVASAVETSGGAGAAADRGAAAVADRGAAAGAVADGTARRKISPEQAEAAEDVLLMVSELVTNACMHAGGPRELVLRHSEDRLRVEVSDGSPEHPRRRPAPNPALPGGHGLIVLERLARAWGSEPATGAWGGKTVWLEVASPLTPDPWRPSAARSAVSPESG
ncbi:ATP-binding protein [Streptomyces sp. SMC 277]|uniref:ATP-binding protein n=2 Tax=Streptomyces antimicrobicus TaxID=2883108 RepID=A0ABS8B9G3_9ACTN|nr:ATP-binding protein [Streptomyces antimicrobicus]MCB5181266.1 ATP-binding protein [Streptomyces antimicrobicus]